jgi:hypothetical protein
MVDRVLALVFTLATADVMGVQMASRWAFRRSRLNDLDPELLFRLNGDIVFTRDYVKHTLFSKKPHSHGTQGVITKIHYNPLGTTSHLDVRLPKGEFLREVPVNFFLA